MRQILRMVWILFIPMMLFSQVVEKKIVTSDATNSDEFGFTVAVDGDVAIIGAHRDRPSGSYSGSAYILTRNSGSWSEQQKLLASDTDSYKRFGNAVDISGSHLVIGAMLAIVVLFLVVIGWTRYVKSRSVKNRKGRSESSPDEES